MRYSGQFAIAATLPTPFAVSLRSAVLPPLIIAWRTALAPRRSALLARVGCAD